MDKLRRSHIDIASFIKAYDPQKLMQVNETRAVTSEKSPFLIVIEKTYGEGSAVIWLMQVLAVFNEYSGKREKLDDFQIDGLARNIVAHYGWLKASEIMLFLNYYANGRYGPIYGSIDPTELMVNLKDKFIPWREKILQEEENKKLRAERESWSKNALKPEEIRKLKERFREINESFTKK